jgi:hypothetical protein
MWMFKADITGCFNPLFFWKTATCLLIGFLLEANILMIMLTCGFGVAVSHMIWSVLGDALNRYVNDRAPSHVFTYVNDFFGAGTYEDTKQSEQIVHKAINGTLGPEGLMRPKDKGIEKLFYVLFSVDISQPLPLKYWQCLASLTNLYSHVIHGMRPNVSPIIHMTQRAHETRPAAAKANTRFAIEIWRAIITVAILDPELIAVPIDTYLGHYGGHPPLYHYLRRKPLASLRGNIHPQVTEHCSMVHGAASVREGCPGAVAREQRIILGPSAGPHPLNCTLSCITWAPPLPVDQ